MDGLFERLYINQKPCRQTFEKLKWVDKKLPFSYKDVTVSSLDTRARCFDNHGVYSATYRRCYVVSKNKGKMLNFNEQTSLCENKGMFLAYPRSFEELEYIWYYYKQQVSFFELDMTLGFTLVNFNSTSQQATYLSADGKHSLTSPDAGWFVSEDANNRTLSSKIIYARSTNILLPELGCKLISTNKNQNGYTMCSFHV